MKIKIIKELGVALIETAEEKITDKIRVEANADGTLTLGTSTYAVKNGVGFVPESFAPNGEYTAQFITTDGDKYELGAVSRFGRFVRYTANVSGILNTLAEKTAALVAENKKLHKEIADLHKKVGVKLI